MDNTILDQNIKSYSIDGTPADIRPNEGRAKAAVLLLYMIIGVQLVFLIMSPMMQSMVDPYSYSPDEMLRNAMIVLGMSLALIVVNILTAIMFIRWFRRAYYNLHIIDGSRLTQTEGWAAGAWFVPVLNLFRPLNIMQEICNETEGHAKRLTGQEFKSAAPLVGWWWGAWITPMIVGIAINFIRDAEILQMMNIVNYTLTVICGVLVIIIIKRVAVMEKVLYEHREHAGLQPVTVQGGMY